MVRLFICILLVLATAALGQSRIQKDRGRLSFLRRTLDGLAVLEGEIRAYAAPLPTAFLRAGAACPLFSAAARLLDTQDAETAFLKALRKENVQNAEAEIFESFALGLLSEDAEGQLANIRRTAKRITVLSEKLAGDTARTARLYGSGGVLFGIALVILLI